MDRGFPFPAFRRASGCFRAGEDRPGRDQEEDVIQVITGVDFSSSPP